MPEIITRTEAKARGLKRYFTGVPCKWGHIDESYVTSGKCLSCHVLARDRYCKSHPDKVKESARVSSRKRRARDLDGHRRKFEEYRKKWIAEHGHEAWRERERLSYQKNREKRLTELREYRAKNKDYFRDKGRKRNQKISDLLIVLRKEMPELLKEFGL